MFKKILFVVVLFFSIHSGAQKMTYKSNGNIRDAENNKISPDKVRALLAYNDKLLAEYNAGRTKKTVGNVLIIGGIGMLAADLLIDMYSPQDLDEYYVPEKRYPSALTYIGIASVVIAIPVKIGFSKKIKNVVAQHNAFMEASGFEPKLEFITNNKGVGLRLTLN